MIIDISIDIKRLCVKGLVVLLEFKMMKVLGVIVFFCLMLLNWEKYNLIFFGVFIVFFLKRKLFCGLKNIKKVINLYIGIF